MQSRFAERYHTERMNLKAEYIRSCILVFLSLCISCRSLCCWLWRCCCCWLRWPRLCRCHTRLGERPPLPAGQHIYGPAYCCHRCAGQRLPREAQVLPLRIAKQGGNHQGDGRAPYCIHQPHADSSLRLEHSCLHQHVEVEQPSKHRQQARHIGRRPARGGGCCQVPAHQPVPVGQRVQGLVGSAGQKTWWGWEPDERQQGQ